MGPLFLLKKEIIALNLYHLARKQPKLYENWQSWKRYEKDEKKLKKVLDKEVKECYYRQADRETGRHRTLKTIQRQERRKEKDSRFRE